MSIKEKVAHELDTLTEAELKQVSDYLAFLKFRARLKPLPAFDENQLASLCREFADEDSKLAEEGLSDYTQGLAGEDSR
jgi:hypothetical protein